ncbi:MAG: hypothetical protein F4220_11545 [Gammaproteobacteria bacterium]|nr:hypothetical protein [Gammaproteobacteria bacterium]
MIKEHKDAYMRWLERGGAKSPDARDTRVYAVQTIERKLGELGTQFRDLEAAWQEDRFESLFHLLRQMRDDARNDGQDYRVLMPKAERNSFIKRISNWSSWLAQYGRFLDGQPPGPSKSQDADRMGNARIDGSALNELRNRFLTTCTDFRSFVDPGSG